MRRADREVKDPKRIGEILSQCKICRLGLNDDGEVYVVPMHAGVDYDGTCLTLYFHCAKEGRRIDVMRKNPYVGFEMDCAGEVCGQGAKGCSYSCAFVSVIGTGYLKLLETPEEKIAGLQHLMRSQTQREFAFTEQMSEGVAVLKLVVEKYSCKEHA